MKKEQSELEPSERSTCQTQNEKMMLYDVVHEQHPQSFMEIQYLKAKKEKQDIICYNLIKKSETEERRSIEEEIEKRVEEELEEIKLSNRSIDNLNDSSLVTISLSNDLISKIHNESIEKNKDAKHCNGIINKVLRDYFNGKDIQHHTTSLLYDGREPRVDVLKRLKVIADYLQKHYSYPNFRRDAINYAIVVTLGPVDERTKKKFLNCINNFLHETTGQKLGFYDDVDITSFVNALKYKLDSV